MEPKHRRTLVAEDSNRKRFGNHKNREGEHQRRGSGRAFPKRNSVINKEPAFSTIHSFRMRKR